ncbi:MAG: DM13 domain-containing protein [Pyrinomonadaceae bacterium]
MQSTKLIFALVIVIAAVAGWYAFRPERLFTNQSVNEQFPTATAAAPAQLSALTSGDFHDVSHKGSGTAAIYQLADGKRVLRFTNFETSNGPDVQVYLVAADDARDAETVKNAGFISLGALKGNVGDQNYDVPANIDLNKYRAVSIWCRRFSANFATAPLRQQQS